MYVDLYGSEATNPNFPACRELILNLFRSFYLKSAIQSLRAT